MTKPRVLIFDIETSPYIVYSWSVGYDLNIGPEMIINEKKIISIAYKWLGEKKVHSLQWEGWAGPGTDEQMLSDFIQIYSQADSVVGHNIKKFDIKVLRGRIIHHGLPDLPEVHIVDTYLENKRVSAVASNKLDYLAKRAGSGGKLKTGFDLWHRCMQGDKKALAEMVKYNKQDVLETEVLYNYLAPYIKTINKQVVNKDTEMCPGCSSKETQKMGLRTTQTGKFQRYRCNDCGKTWSDTKKVKDAKP